VGAGLPESDQLKRNLVKNGNAINLSVSIQVDIRNTALPIRIQFDNAHLRDHLSTI